MTEFTLPESRGMDGLYVIQFGEEVCEGGHAFGPAVRDHYLIHFVASGEGRLFADGRWHAVSAGQGFLILPGERTFYQASDINPWHYAWVGYKGENAEDVTRMAGLGRENRVFETGNARAAWQALEELRQEARALRLGQMAAVGGLYRFLSLCAPAADPSPAANLAGQYLDKAIWYMEGNYDRDVTVQRTADFVGLSRSQLYRVFMEESGRTPKEALMAIRLQRARQLLAGSTLTVEEIARQVGLNTGAQLGAAFRRVYGISPGGYRKESRRG